MEGEELELQPSARRTSSCGSAPRPTEEESRPNENHVCTQTPGFHEVLKNCGFFYTGSEPIDSLFPAWSVDESHDPARLECGIEPSIRQELNPGSLREVQFCRQRVTPGIEILPRPLHSRMRQGFHVTVDERIKFHLDTTGRQLHIKPLPRFLLDHRFWAEALFSDGDPDENERERRERLFEIALGLLFSYAGLIRHESDFHIAMENQLLPQDMTWLKWRKFITGLDMKCVCSKMHPWFCRDKTRGLVYYTLIGRFKRFPIGSSELFQVLGAGAIYATLVLAAFQTGLATEFLGGSTAFSYASSAWVIFMLVYLACIWLVVGFVVGNVLFSGFFFPSATEAPRRTSRLSSVSIDEGSTGSA